MVKKKICISFEHMKPSNGVSRAAFSVANLLVKKYDVTLIPLFSFDKETLKMISPEVHVTPVFGFYFHSFAQIVDLIPDRLLYWFIFGRRHFDLEIAFQMIMPTKIIAGAPRRSKNSRIAWMHGYDEGLVLRSQYERIGKVVCVSRQNAERLAKELPTIVADYCYNPIDDKLVVKQGGEPIELRRPDDCLLFVSVGRHSPEKGYMRLLNIVRRLTDEGYHFRLWLVGDGPQHQQLVSHADELKLGDVVTFTGADTNPHKYTSKADVFICSSFREGYSTACTEAIMLGVPVISTDVGGSREIIEDSEAGIHCALDDEALYNAMKTVLDNPQMIGTWKEKLKTTSKRFSQEERSKKLFDLVEEGLTNA